LEFILAHDKDQSMKLIRSSEEQINHRDLEGARGRRFGRRPVPQTERPRRQLYK
jgi:hypothetical protein